ncbi:hypothetical protein DH2020_019385 [Rehmannia glutinosa]|uniref:CCHC-type domain-containing protein n=1 Tax=Rehmannia glutinosa TaxID=99300 RepID=A0ABR0WNK8_REHGL
MGLGVQGNENFYIMAYNTLKCLGDDKDIRSWCLKYVKIREMHIWVSRDFPRFLSLEESNKVLRDEGDSGEKLVEGDSGEKLDEGTVNVEELGDEVPVEGTVNVEGLGAEVLDKETVNVEGLGDEALDKGIVNVDGLSDEVLVEGTVNVDGLDVNVESLGDSDSYIESLLDSDYDMAGEISDEVDDDVLPSKARRREPDEPNTKQKKNNRGKQPMRLKRQQFSVTCRKCGVPGHNSTTCVKNGADQPVKKLRVRKKMEQRSRFGDTIEQGNASTATNVVLGGLQNVPPTEDDFLLDMEMNQIFDYLSQSTSGVSFQPQVNKVPGPSMFEQLQMSKGQPSTQQSQTTTRKQPDGPN